MKTTKPERPDYTAMADTLLQIAQELKTQARDSGNPHDLDQAERLERIAADLRAGAAAMPE
ncbi:MAG: hypothetical protein JNK21_12485 [Rhodospirillaceae bacterium]|nr:hypothetical protein [Rhodospirillaceae bacterium]